jgi:hypothetical protein
MKTPKYLKHISGPEEGLSPKAEELYKMLIRNHKDGIPVKMVGEGMMKELGKLVKTSRGKVRINTSYISQFYSDYIRKNIEEQPYFATSIVLTVFGEIEDHEKSYGSVCEEIMLGVLKGLQEPIKSDREEVRIKIAVYKNPRRFGIETETIVPAE